VSSSDAVINLAGASIFGKWTPRRKRQIMESRAESTANVVAALSRRAGPPAVLLSASAVGYYGFRDDEELDEKGAPGDDFLAQVTRRWEETALQAAENGHRVILARFGLVLGETGGTLGQMVPLYKFGLGGPLGDGRQWFSWIHIDDLAAAVLFLVGRGDISGPVNVCAPNPVRNRDLAKALGRTLRRPSFLRAPAFAIRLLLGEFGTVVLKGQRVVPRRLLEAGFGFRFPSLEVALADLLNGTRRRNGRRQGPKPRPRPD